MNVHAAPKEARRTPAWFDELPNALENAWDELDFETTDAYAALQELATVVRIEGHSIDTESSVVAKGQWIAPGTIYVTLVYDPKSEEAVELPDSYPISIRFAVADKVVTIEGVSANTSSFYE